MRSGGRIRSLDGVRAVSVALVLLGHILPTQASGDWHIDLGTLGVRIFFVISGLLITTLLIHEHEAEGRIAIGRFYLRRTLRIFPPFYAFLAVAAALGLAGWIALPWADVLHAATYTMNYVPSRAWSLGHTWSLAVEEQFYLLWPPALVFLGMRRGLRVSLGFLLLAPLLRLASFWIFPGGRAGIGETFPTTADAIATGCALAFARDALWERAWYRRLQRSRLFLLVPVIGLFAHGMNHHARLSFAVGMTVVNVAVALCLDHVIRFPEGPAGRFLNLRPVTFVGVISYSIYLWQQLFLNREGAAWIQGFPQCFALFAPALASYYLIERPALRLRGAIEARLFRAPRAAEAPPREVTAPAA